MKVTEVNDKKSRRQFLDFPKQHYRGDSNWTCLLDVEIESIFNPNHNDCFKQGDAARWILFDDNDILAGRITVFYDMKKANGSNLQPTGGIGFFECINNQEAANLLFDTAKIWLTSKGMEAMDGPVNFGENFVHWGLLVEGFMPQAYGMPYNYPYYKTLFENYGFQTYFEQYSYHVDLTKPFPERQEKFARFVMRKANYSFEHIDFKNYKKYLNDAVEVYNAVWSDFHEDYTPLKYTDFEKIFIDAKELLMEDLIVFAYDDGKPIGMIVTFPDLNQVFKKLNGKLHLINKLRLLYYKKKNITRARQLVSGVIPEYQKAGIIGPMFLKMVDGCKKHEITELEMSWVGDYNETVNKMYQQMEIAIKAKTHMTYRYLFDQSKPFVRFTNTHSHKSQKQNIQTE